MCSHLLLQRLKERGLIYSRLRQVDVKAEHFERQVSRAEQERDEWERKHGVSFSNHVKAVDYQLIPTRKQSRSTSSPSESSTRSSPRWSLW